jgi:dCTP deaminase
MYLSGSDLVRVAQRAIYPYHDQRLQPASYDLALGDRFTAPAPACAEPLDPLTALDDRRYQDHGPTDAYLLPPHHAVLALTAERLRVPLDHVARVEGKSTLGRLFLLVHVTAGWIDPGFDGLVTLEIVNLAPWPVVLRPGMPIAQVSFARLSQRLRRGYHGHYQHQERPLPPALPLLTGPEVPRA